MSVLRSTLKDVYIPDSISFPKFILERCKQFSNQTAFIDGITGRKLTYNEYSDSIQTVSAALYYIHGVRKGDVMCIFMSNCFEYAIIVHSMMSIGGIITTCNPLYTSDGLLTQIHDSNTKFVMTMPEFLPKVKKIIKHTNIKKVFIIGEARGCISFNSLLSYSGKAPPVVNIDSRNDVALLPYSSGTTGKSKGVMLTHYNMVANCCQSCDPSLEVGVKGDIFVWILPFYHMFGISVVFSFIPNIGGTTVILPRFEMETYLQCVQKYKATFLYIVPPVAVQLAKSPLVSKYNLSSIRCIWYGAAPMGRDLQEELQNHLNVTEIKQGYGMTETSPMTLIAPTHDWTTGSAGILVPNTLCKVIHTEKGYLLGPNKHGEICFKGPQVMKGYLGNPAATKQTIDGQGWIYTGDIGYYDEDQNFYIVDRLKELIKYKGYQVAPAELESLILTHECVSDVAVIGRHDYEAGEVPMAFVVTKPHRTVTEEELVNFVNGQVPPYKKLRGGVVFINQIPKSTAGKILRRLLRDKLNTMTTSKL